MKVVTTLGTAMVAAAAVTAATALALALPSPSATSTAQDDSKKSGDSKKGMDAETQRYVQLASPGSEHARMAKRVGTWDLKVKFWPEAGGEPVAYKHKAVLSMDLDNRFLVERIDGLEQVEGFGKFKATRTTGFNNGAKRYEFSWIDSWSTGMATGTGMANAKGDVAWSTEMYDASHNRVVKFREMERTMPDGSIVREMFGPGPDGKEVKTMEMVYVRKG